MLQEAIEGLRLDVKSWLDLLHSSMLNALQNKVNHNQLDDVAKQISRAAGMAGESIAAFAKRALIGKCASCDTPINVDAMLAVRRPQPLSLQSQWPTHRSSGAHVAIRAPEGRARSPAESSTGKLPKIQDVRINKDFPKGKVLKNASSPELRQGHLLSGEESPFSG